MTQSADAATRYIGQRRKRVEDLPLLTGNGRYASDITFPGMAHLAFARSTQPHARITHIETSRAAAMPGVLGVFTAGDLIPIMKTSPFTATRPSDRTEAPTPLAADTVRYVGEAVAVVLAGDRYAAEDAAEAIAIAYEPLPAVVDPERAGAARPLLHAGYESNVAEHFEVTIGDGEGALDRAAHVVEASFSVGRVTAQPMEPLAVVASYDAADERLTVYLGSQAVHRARQGLSAILGIPAERIRVVAPDVGGAFGVKSRLYGEEIIAAYLAVQQMRPVKWVGDRREEFINTGQGRAQTHRVKLGLDGDGRIAALVDHFIQDAGAYSVTAGGSAHNTARILPGPYRVPHSLVTCDVVFTNTVPVGPYRGAGRPEAAYVMERILDRAADAMGIDRIEIRRRNLIRPDELPYKRGEPGSPGALEYDEGDYPDGMQRVLDAIGYEGFRERQAAERARGIYVGVGVANSLEMGGIEAGESAIVRITPDGTVTATVGVVATGQGHRTAYAQVVAERLGVPFERVEIVEGDTAAIGQGIGTFASRSTVAAGNALSAAARELRRRVLGAAAERLEVAADDLEWAGERIGVRGAPSKSVPYWEVVRDAGGPFEQQSSGPGPRTYGYQGHGVIVEVDLRTCAVRIRDYAICHDGGAVVNPLLAEGQTIGAVVQGLGVALWEAMRVDGDGRPLTTSLHNYLLPTATETPDFRILEQHFPARNNAEGFKGVGEGGAIPCMPAIAQALEDALAPFGVRFDDVPITPQVIHDALARGGQGGDA